MRAFLLTVMVLMLVFPFNLAFAQPTQLSFTVNLNRFVLQVTYPAEVMPGNNVSVSVEGTPKTSNTYLQTLVVTVYYADSAGLHLVGTQTLVSNAQYAYYAYGYTPTGSFSKAFTVSVPQNASRTSLLAVFSETVQFNYNVLYRHYSLFHHFRTILLTYSGTETDDAITPLSYIEATTPEYVSLQSAYQMLQQRLNQTRTQNQQLQTTVTRQSAMIGQLNQQLTSANITAQTYESVVAVFVIIAVALAAFSIYQIRNKAKTRNPT